MSFKLTLLIVGAFVIAALSFFIGIFVYLNNRKSAAAKFFALMNLCLAGWCVFGLGLGYLSHTPSKAVFWMRLGNLFPIFIAAFYFHFVVALLNQVELKKRILKVIYTLAGLILCLAIIFPQHWIGRAVPKMYFRYAQSDAGFILYFYTFFFLAVGIYSFYLLIREYKTLSGNKRRQIGYLILAAFIGFGSGSTTFFIAYDISIDPIFVLLIIFFPLIISYAIFKHQFMDIKIIITKGTIYAVLIALITGCLVAVASLNYWFIENLPNYSSWMMMAAGAVFAFFVGKYFFDKNKELKNQMAKLDRNAKMLVRRDLELSLSREKLAQEKGKIAAVINSLVDGLIMVDQDQKIVLINPEAERILNIKEKEVVNKKIDQITGSENLNKLYETLSQKIEWTKQKYKLVLEKPFKKFFQVSIVKVAVEEAEVGLMVILHDVTRDKEIDRMKTEFISIAAHQLRTPLSAVKWALQMILNGHMGKIDPEVREYLRKSYQSNERMIHLVNDLLNISRIEEGRFLYDLKLVSIKDIIKEAIFSSKVLLSKRKIKVKFNAPKSKIPKIKADAKKMKLAIQNLVDNAIRYSMAGSEVIINLEQIKEKKNNFVKIEIKDYGIGINIKDQERLFSKFFRGGNAVRFQTEGSGLGLFIVKNIIEAHYGKIWFKSEENKGTTFYVKLPINNN